MKKTAKHKLKIDWSRLDAMTEAERHAAATADPDARPMTDEEVTRACLPRLGNPAVGIMGRPLDLLTSWS
jgi:putative transcriptional regulator